jgi:butyryl-CoA dehydrogenase
MNFRLTSEQTQLQQAALPLLAEQLEERNEPAPRELIRRFARLGYLGRG